MTVANQRLIQAEIKSLEGYNSKLVQKLLDQSTVSVDADGKISGLTEAMKVLETEFPEIKSQKTVSIPPSNTPKGTDTDDYSWMKNI
jgi:hypothetical protein